MNNDKAPINVDYFEDLTGSIDACEDGSCVEQIGDRIRRLREEKGVSVVELSQLTGFDEQTLRDIEKNILTPQLGTIIKLSKALDAALQRIISGEGRKTYAVTRKDDRQPVNRSVSPKGRKAAYTYSSLAPDVKGRHMESLMVRLEKATDDERSVHSGEEFIYVLEGTVLLDIGQDHFELAPGDSAYYLSTTPHLLGAKHASALILAVIYSE